MDALFIKEKDLFGHRIRRALAFVLGFLILFFCVMKRMPEKHDRGITKFSMTPLYVDLIPNTVQGGLPRMPTVPQVPIPSEDDYVPADETIDSTRLNLAEGIVSLDGWAGSGDQSGGGGGWGGIPRPLHEVIPEYPREEQAKGIEGVVELALLVNSRGRVDSVVVKRNTSRNATLERAAIEAAIKSTYMPAKQKGRNISMWIQRPYHFQKAE
jgi:TonB family protein